MSSNTALSVSSISSSCWGSFAFPSAAVYCKASSFSPSLSLISSRRWKQTDHHHQTTVSLADSEVDHAECVLHDVPLKIAADVRGIDGHVHATGLPSPEELILAALGTSTLRRIRHEAAKKNWKLGATSVTVSHERVHAKDVLPTSHRNPEAKVDVFHEEVHIEGDLTHDQRVELLKDASSRCNVRALLASENVIQSKLVGEPQPHHKHKQLPRQTKGRHEKRVGTHAKY